MKIVIAGAGAVGTHLAKLLSHENQDIVLIDEDINRLNRINSDYDLLTVNVNPTSIAGLREAGADKADLFIGVTPEETKNMTCCMLASNMGAKKTVARIDNYEYLNPSHQQLFQSMGVNSLIYPEMLAAQEIVDSIRMSWVRQWWEVNNGALIMLGIKLRESAQILNCQLKDLESNKPYHIVAIQRDNDIIIPGGNDMLQLHDLVYFMTTKKFIPHVRKLAGKDNDPDVRKVMIMGGGRTALRVVLSAPEYMHFTIFEQDVNRCDKLNELINKENVLIVNGDGRDLSLLLDEGIEDTDAFVALSGNAETNIISCLSARNMGVSKTVAMIENLDYVKMGEQLDIGTIINKKTIAAGHIYQMMLDADVSNVKCLTIANADVAEFIAKEGSVVTTTRVKDLGLPKGATIGGLVRNGEGKLVNGLTLIQPGDNVVVFCANMMIKKLEKYFN